MKTRSSDEIRSFLHRQVELWNAGRKDEMFACYHQMVPGNLSIEYVGLPVLEGWAALEDMWQRFAGKVHIGVKEVMVTGSEAACYHHNQTIGADTPPRPSIELYKFDGDDVQIRYFHAAAL
ncbi:MAG: hypothetical protein JWP96_1578 [Polaromonas sp.]|nr:hypothetical protein [Polaromonas sp.]